MGLLAFVLHSVGGARISAPPRGWGGRTGLGGGGGQKVSLDPGLLVLDASRLEVLRCIPRLVVTFGRRDLVGALQCLA